MRAIILSGGHGTRLKPLTDHTPKSLIEIAGTPILEYLITYAGYAGVSSITCISDVQKPVRPWLEKHKPFVRIVDQDSPDGTGQAVWLALKDLAPKKGQGLMVMLGDIVPTSLVLADMIRNEPAHSILGIRETDTPEQGAVVEYDRKGWLNRVTEKPQNPKTNKILSGVFYFADADRFFTAQSTLIRHNVRIHNTTKPPAGEFDIVGTITMKHQYGESFKLVPNPVFDVGTFEGIKAAENYYANNANW